mgnify:FL=1
MKGRIRRRSAVPPPPPAVSAAVVPSKPSRATSNNLLEGGTFASHEGRSIWNHLPRRISLGQSPHPDEAKRVASPPRRPSFRRVDRAGKQDRPQRIDDGNGSASQASNAYRDLVRTAASRHPLSVCDSRVRPWGVRGASRAGPEPSNWKIYGQRLLIFCVRSRTPTGDQRSSGREERRWRVRPRRVGRRSVADNWRVAKRTTAA